MQSLLLNPFSQFSAPALKLTAFQKAAKTQAARNTAKLNQTLIATAVVHLFFLLLRALLFSKSFTRKSLILWVALSTPSWVVQFWFERIGRPQYGSQPGEVRKSGEDLDAKGLTEWMWDVLYWTYGCVLLAAVAGDWAWWLYAVVPAYSAYLAYTALGGAKQMMSGMAGAGGEGTPAGQSKRQQKMEKRGPRVQYR